MKQQDFLVEIQTEELPPKALHQLGRSFLLQIKQGLQQASLDFNAEDSQFFATPRRLAVLIRSLDEAQADQEIERKGPARAAAFDDKGKPTQACAGFAKSCGTTPEQLQIIKTSQGEWLGFKQSIKGKAVADLLPAIVTKAVQMLPVPKRMRWGDSDIEFTRPVHAVVMLYGSDVIEATVLNCKAGNKTLGHRFMSSGEVTLPSASEYAHVLEKEGKVIVSFARRRELIKQLSQNVVKESLGSGYEPLIEDALLDEVTGLVEWPVALCGQFDKDFLQLPKEVLISSMQDHQRYFPVNTDGRLAANFVSITNIESKDSQSIVTGNERVLRARLADAAFFFATDKQTRLDERLEKLKNVLYQAKLGTLYDKAGRLAHMAKIIANKMGLDNKAQEAAHRAGLLAKTDLLSLMVGEFPELQGIMGSYYARQDDEISYVVAAIREQYQPRFAGDKLPKSSVGQALALADKLDALVGAFGINQIPTGDKDPFGLRRAAIGLLRIMLEGKLDLDLQVLIDEARQQYGTALTNQNINQPLLGFMQERLKALYQEQGTPADVFAAVAALGVNRPVDVERRIQAVKAFKKLAEAEALSIANKRVSNILQKQLKMDGEINAALFEKEAERVLAEQIANKQKSISSKCAKGEYEDALMQLAELREPIDNFFDHVMVMTDDKPRRENRILLLNQLRQLFLHVADIALLQS